MRYQIIRHEIRITLLLILLATTLTWSVPLVYENIFVHEEDFDYGIKHHLATVRSLVRDTIAEGIDKDISIDLHFINNGYVFSELNIEDLDLKGMVISADVIVKGQFIRDEEDGSIGFSGKVFSKDMAVNSYQPAHVRMSFKIARNELEITSLRLGRSYELKGKVSLASPFETDLRLEINRANIRDFAMMAKAKNPNIAFGVVNGTFDIKGSLSGLFSDGTLHSKSGKVGPVEYDLATVRLEGFGPIINIVDSSIMQGKGSVTLEGYLDLRNIEKGGLLDGLRVKSDLEKIVWDEWAITKYGTDRLGMSKDIGDKMRVGFKTMTREPLTTYQDRENPEEMSLEYKMGMENLKMRLKENEEFFGIEHSVKF